MGRLGRWGYCTLKQMVCITVLCEFFTDDVQCYDVLLDGNQCCNVVVPPLFIAALTSLHSRPFSLCSRPRVYSARFRVALVDPRGRMDDDNDTRTSSAMTTTTIYNQTRSPLKCEIKDVLLEHPLVQFLLFSLYCLIFIVAVSGNLLVIFVVLRKKTMQTVTNIFITNLAISDIIVNFTSLWLTPSYMFIGRWVWGELLCQGLPLFQGMSIFISTLTLTAIAVDRYFVIVSHSPSINANDRMTMQRCLIIIASIWVISFALVFPYALHMEKMHIDGCGFYICTEVWVNKESRFIFGMVVMVLQFAVPFFIIGVSYMAIWMFLESRRWASERSIETRRRKRLLTMLITMVVIFGVCWFPFNMMNILRDLNLVALAKDYFKFVFLVIHVISMTATCWNPILYAWMNDNFREEFLRVIPFTKSKNVPRVKMISECQPATNRTNCSEAPALSKSSRKSMPNSKAFETMLLTADTDQPCNMSSEL
ncbi:hypothetical protein PMAYCL1PPCAC_31158 [Pristionchus mayeri]|uniref:G-protein coupled receptors family 1 profile domain-containing protein n=1 Tax=Pristionchus mayeri TaxID=1317129 RepID=A0AAN5DCH4_9BILA|nr:hypothetical protein PMAYCL1PPCAC_31158 [Pristionchus mayeri]